MKKYWPAFLILLIVILVLGWYLFRPELIFINKKVNEAHPAALQNQTANMVNIASGHFSSVAHETIGEVTLLRVNGKIILRLAKFRTSNGPDVRVYLIKVAKDQSIDEAIKQKSFIDLGPLKGNIGDQNYELPMGVDANQYNAVSIWCRRFGVNFGEAIFLKNGGEGTR